MSKPKILPAAGKNKNPLFDVKGMHHPCLIQNDKKPFVPNDVNLSNLTTILITGPNMGGKSTLLR